MIINLAGATIGSPADPHTIPGVLRKNANSLPCSLYAYALNSYHLNRALSKTKK